MTAFGQNGGAPAATYKSAEEIDAVLNQVQGAGAAGAAVTVSPGVSVRKRMSNVKQFAIVHPWSMEIYRILEGSGTFVTGGRLIPPLADSPSADVVRTEHGIEGGLARTVKAGDVLVLQPGTPHWFSTIDGESITYMESRIQISTHPIRYD
jgi:mannose-6-phosphate isomerase-like protein (cupin superfamily)